MAGGCKDNLKDGKLVDMKIGQCANECDMGIVSEVAQALHEFMTQAELHNCGLPVANRAPSTLQRILARQTCGTREEAVPLLTKQRGISAMDDKLPGDFPSLGDE